MTEQPENKYKRLFEASSPDKLRELAEDDLPEVAKQLREYMLETVSKSGGHLASSLGVVELSVALHYVFNTPDDRIVWDVGHQSYPHKILTGRINEMLKIRQKGGISGFPKRGESDFDAFGVGHSSTSISALLGMSEASKLLGDIDRKFIAVIGDGALTAGEAFEALNHAGGIRSQMLVILNDNNMSISENVGALRQYFAKILSGKFYSTIREGSKRVLKKMPNSLMELARKAEEHVKGMVVPGTLFEEFGFNYIGPIDGHDLSLLVQTLGNIKDFEGPKILHVITQKGKGYEPAEKNPTSYHGVTPFDLETGESEKIGEEVSYTQVFSKWVCDMAEREKNLVAITPAMKEGSGLVDFANRFPERFYDVAIAEQHSVTFAAGLACEGIKPVLAIYSTFLQRGYDQLMHDVALQNLPVLFAIDRAGIVGADGPTHNGNFDISFMRCLPNMIIMVPSSLSECYRMLYSGYKLNCPVAVRYPRLKYAVKDFHRELIDIPTGKGEVVRSGKKVAILAFGVMLEQSQEVADKRDYSLVNMRFVKPLDEDLIIKMAESHDYLITIEDNAIAGGAGSGINEFLISKKFNTPVLNLGIPDRYIEHGSRSEVLSEIGLSPEGIDEAIESFINYTP